MNTPGVARDAHARDLSCRHVERRHGHSHTRRVRAARRAGCRQRIARATEGRSAVRGRSRIRGGARTRGRWAVVAHEVVGCARNRSDFAVRPRSEGLRAASESVEVRCRVEVEVEVLCVRRLRVKPVITSILSPKISQSQATADCV